MDTLKKIAGWVFFYPILYVALIVFKTILLVIHRWVSEQVHEDSGWAYFVASTAFSTIWIPFMILFWLIIWVIKICPKPQIGGAIALTLMVVSGIHYYFISDSEITRWTTVIADLVIVGTLAYITFNERATSE